MANPPSRRRSASARDAADAAFKAVTTKPPETPQEAPKKPTLPNAKELVSIRLDRDVIEHFQDGPGWQERINDILRRAMVVQK